MAAAGRNDPSSAPHEALGSMPTHQMDRRQLPEQAGIILGAVEGVYGPQNTPMLWQCIITRTKQCFEGHTNPQSPPKLPLLAWGGCHPSIQSIGAEHKASCGALGGHLCWQRPWLWRLWRQLCFVLRLLKNVKNTKISYFKSIFVLITIYCKTYCNSHNTNCSMARAQVVAWPKPKPLLSNGTSEYWVSLKSFCHCETNSCIVLRPKCRNEAEREKRLSTSYLELLFI